MRSKLILLSVTVLCLSGCTTSPVAWEAGVLIVRAADELVRDASTQKAAPAPPFNLKVVTPGAQSDAYTPSVAFDYDAVFEVQVLLRSLEVHKETPIKHKIGLYVFHPGGKQLLHSAQASTKPGGVLEQSLPFILRCTGEGELAGDRRPVSDNRAPGQSRSYLVFALDGKLNIRSTPILGIKCLP